MNPISRLVGLLLLLGGLPSLFGQVVVITEYKKKPHIVRHVVRNTPYIEIDKKLIAAPANRFALHEVPEFVPVLISVRNIRVGTHAIELMDTASRINNEFELTADFSSAYALKRVFLVLELLLEDGTKRLFLQEIGTLGPDRPRSVRVRAPLNFPLGAGEYRLHLFVNGGEALHSQQPFNYREAMLDKMIAMRIKDRADGPPAPFIGPPPVYPKSLEKSKPHGRTVVQLRVHARGAVTDAQVIDASDPAFGEAAVEALRQWRFYPRIQAGRAVDATVNVPLDFVPPS